MTIYEVLIPTDNGTWKPWESGKRHKHWYSEGAAFGAPRNAGLEPPWRVVRKTYKLVGSEIVGEEKGT